MEACIVEVAFQSCKSAMEEMGLRSYRGYANYRKWLPATGDPELQINPGQRPSPRQVEVMRLMSEFCRRGHGRFYSKNYFCQLYRSGTLVNELRRLNIRYDSSKWIPNVYG